MFITQINQLSAPQLLDRAMAEILSHEHTRAYAGLLMVGESKVQEDVSTACTDGINCYYGKEFFSNLTDSDRRGVIIHEVLHVGFRDMFVWQHLFEEDADLANRACDYVNNMVIKDLERVSRRYITLPEIGLFDPQFAGMDAGQVYEILRKRKQEEQQQQQKQQQGGSPQDQQQQQQQGGQGQQSKQRPMDDHQWQKAKSMSKEEQEQLSKDIDQAIRQGLLASDKLGGSKPQALADLLTPEVDWREQLREFVTDLTRGGNLSTWRRPSRRWLQYGMYMPSAEEEKVGRIVVANDTSGSIGEMLTTFLTEVQSMVMTTKPEKVDLLYWDTKVRAHEVYTEETYKDLATKTKPEGGGGTLPSCIPKYMQTNQIKPICAIVLTDGEVFDWGTWDCPVLWCIVGNKRVVPPVGKAIYVK